MGEVRQRRYRFGRFQLDTGEYLLLCDGEAVPLTPKAFEALRLLVQSGGRVVSKEKLLDALWPDSHVEENNLAVTISMVRKALGVEGGGKGYVETVPKRGYRFTAGVEELPDREAQAAAGGGGHARVAAFRAMGIRRLTGTGKALAAAISPDGQYVVYATDEGETQSLWVKQVAAATGVQVISPDTVRYKGLTFCPGGDFVYCVVYRKAVNRGILYQVPVLGGTQRKMIEDIDSPVTFSPDGRRLAFLRGASHRKETYLITANADGSGEKILATSSPPDEFECSAAGPAWSPDGSVIVTPVGHTTASDMSVSVVSTKSGAVRVVTGRRWQGVGRVAWVGDGSGFVLTAREQPSGVSQVWHVAYPGGEVRRITNDLNDYGGVTLTAGGDALAVVQSERYSSIWVVQAERTESARRVTPGKYDGSYGLCWTPDRKIVYSSGASGMQDIWMTDLNGSSQTQLTAGPYRDVHPAVTPDGRHVVFISNRSGSHCVWRIDIDGNNPRRLTNGEGDSFPQCSPDGEWVVYQSHVSGKQSLWKVPVGGGEPLHLTEEFTAWPAVSPDGKRVICEHCDEESWQYSFAVVPFEGGAPAKLFDLPPTLAVSRDQTGSVSSVLRWTPDGRAVAYIDNREGHSNVWHRALEGGDVVRVTNFASDLMFWFDWSPDASLLACARGGQSGDVVLITSLKDS